MKALTTSQCALLELLKIAIGTTDKTFDFSTLKYDDWKEMVEGAVLHTVHLMAYDAAGRVKNLIPKDIKEKWMRMSVSTISRNLVLLEAQQELIRLLADSKYEYIILKGTASASYYPDYEKRCFGDIDFLIDPLQKKDIENTLKQNGYSCVLEDYVCHSVFEKDGVQFELHYEVAGLPEGECGDLFRKYLEGAEAKSFVNRSPEFKNPSPEIHATILLLHTLHHLLDEGIGLRHLCDWACFVEKTHGCAFWNADVLPLLEKTGTLKFAATITKTCSMYLGTACPEWAENIDEQLCGSVINDIVSLGNFGRLNKVRSISGKMITNREKNKLNNKRTAYLKNKIHSLHKRVKKQTKYKLLIPFSFVYLLVKSIVLMFFGKKVSVFETAIYANKRESIYSQFDLYSTNKAKEE